MPHRKSFYEIELKAEPLTREQFEHLRVILPKKYKTIGSEILTSERFRPGDIRVRWGERRAEIVEKTGDPTQIVRYETITTLQSEKEAQVQRELFRTRGLHADPTWIKHKWEFSANKNGYTYTICLQDIVDFAYILEVEFLDKKDTSAIHQPNITAIIEELGLKPLQPEAFRQLMTQYIKTKGE